MLTLIEQMPWTILLSMDNFYKPLTKEQRKLAFERSVSLRLIFYYFLIRLTHCAYSKYDFDSPDAIDMDMFVQVLSDLKAGYVFLFFFSISLLENYKKKTFFF